MAATGFGIQFYQNGGAALTNDGVTNSCKNKFLWHNTTQKVDCRTV